jgi:hypothetical protein
MKIVAPEQKGGATTRRAKLSIAPTQMSLVRSHLRTYSPWFTQLGTRHHEWIPSKVKDTTQSSWFTELGVDETIASAYDGLALGRQRPARNGLAS